MCAQFFQHYDDKLDDQIAEQKKMEAKQQEWTCVLINPLTFNASKLASVEFRQEYEEEIRIKEFNILQNHLNKLIYSIEEERKSVPGGKFQERLEHLRKSL